jgi:tetratricopeptide (TPR) repeat protein
MDAGLWLTAVGSAAGVAGTLLAAWQVRQHKERRPEKPPGGGETGDAGQTGGLPVGVPFGRLPAEIRGRDALLAELRGVPARRVSVRFPLARRPGRVWVLAGMGGLGKSTIALSVAQTAREKGWRVWWVTAADTASLTGGMLEVLHELDAPETVTRPVSRGEPAAVDRAWAYLNGPHPAGRRWLLIFDNADDPAVLAAPGATSPADHLGWLRPDPRGIVIVTTRIMDARTWGPGISRRELPPLDDDAAAQVLADLAPAVPDPDGQQARKLGRRLGGLPLALHLAGSYLASPFARWHTFAEYHRALDSVELPVALDDLHDSAADARTDIQRTWDLSLDALAVGRRPQARPLLLLLSCYAPATPIPVGMLRPHLLTSQLAAGRLFPGGTGDTEAERERRMRSALRGLVMTGLIDTTGRGDAQAFTVHPVVADVNRARLRSAAIAVRRGISDAALRLLRAACGELDRERPAHWAAWRGLVPHVLALHEWLADLLSDAALADLLEVSSLAAEALVLSGAPGTAEKLARAAEAAGARLSADHPARMAARRALAFAVAEQGRNQDAERLYRDVLADQERVLGRDHPLTLTTRFELARVLGFVRPTGAERPHRQVLADQERVLGHDGPVTLATRHWLGRLLVRFGRYEEAEHLYQEVLEGRIRTLGPDHPDTLVTRHTLAWAIAKQGRYAEAEWQFREVIEDQGRVEGARHPHVLGSGRALGWCIAKQGRYAEAEQQLRRVLEIQRQVRGRDHPATLETVHTLAFAVAAQGRSGEAERLYRQALAGRIQRLGENHRSTLDTYHMLALVIADQDRYTEAEEMLRHALAGREGVLGRQHPDTQITRQALEQLVSSRGRAGTAPERKASCGWFRRARRLREP